MPRRICVVVTARPSYSRIRSALRAIAAHRDLELQLVVTASALDREAGAVDQVIEAEGLRIDRRVASYDNSAGLGAMVRTTANGMLGLAPALEELAPDAVLSIADRFETMATAVTAAYMNIPLVHVQGGEVTGSIDEKVRHAITKLADLHLVASQAAAQRVRRMGEAADSVIVTGCPSIDVAREALLSPAPPFDAAAHGEGGAPDLRGDFIVVLQHPVTTEYDQAAQQVEETLHAVRSLDLPTLWFWPNIDAGADAVSQAIRDFRARHGLGHVGFIRNLPPEDFIRLLDRCRVILGNSSVGIRETAWLGVPSVNIGSRQQGRDRAANVCDVGHERSAILAAVRRQIAHGRYPCDLLWGDGHAGQRIAAALAGAPLTIAKRFVD